MIRLIVDKRESIFVRFQAQPAAQPQPAQAFDPYAQYRGGQQAANGQNPYYRSAAASNPQAQYQYEDQSSEERGVKYDDE